MAKAAAGQVDDTETVAKRKRAAVAVYVVQKKFEGGPDDDSKSALWEDVATVSVPGGSGRKRIAEEAERAGLVLPATIRILDASAAEELPVSRGQAGPPPLVIG